MDIEGSITKRSDMETNYGLSCFQDHGAQQNPAAFTAFYEFLLKEKPARVLEIGTALGGFTMFLRIVSNEVCPSMDIRTYDIYEKPWYDNLRDSNIDVRIENIFGADYGLVDLSVIDYISKEGTTVVLCDGGWKIGEFNTLSNYIKPGDYIMAHDYAPNMEIFARDYDRKIWNWCEITDKDIADACERNLLASFMNDEFNGAAWVCKTRLA